MSKFTTQRNFGFGKQMDWAGHQALKDLYGRGHFGTVASHAQRWRQFCNWARSNHGINDACAIDQSLMESYAADLAERVEDETLAVSYAQNLIVSANITMEALRQDKIIRIKSPASWVGKRQTVRTRVPDGMDWVGIDRLVACLRRKNLHRTAVIVLLCRSFGIRLREAILANYAEWHRQAKERGQIDVRDGTKGGRGKEVERWVPVSERGKVALREAIQVRSQLGGQNLLRTDESFDDLVNDGEVHRARKVLHEFGIKGYHELRAAWACERYEEISGETAPILQAGSSPGQQNDDQFRLTMARELGHDRIDVVAAYIGPRP
ncbi:MAG: integrase domain-containing protein [Rhodocyclaceae bacterium]|nr:integrase domain-containing protein [Rhodocyclaceae bacterium]